MKALSLIVVLFAILATHVSAEEKPPLKVDAGAKWKVEYEGDDGLQFFTLSQPANEDVIFMFSRWPVPGGKEQIPGLVKKIAEAFIKIAAEQEELKGINKEYKTEKVVGAEFAGEVAVFDLGEGVIQTIFMLSNGDGIWNGQFTGDPASWKEARKILESLKTNAE